MGFASKELSTSDSKGDRGKKKQPFIEETLHLKKGPRKSLLSARGKKAVGLPQVQLKKRRGIPHLAKGRISSSVILKENLTDQKTGSIET